MGVSLSFLGTSDSTRGQSLHLHQERFTLDIGKNFVTDAVTGHWPGLRREALQ